MALDTVGRQEVLIIFEFKLLVFVESNFGREVDVSVKIVDHYVKMSLFLSVIGFAEVNLVGNILLTVVNVNILSVAQGQRVLLGSGETNGSDA